jgi:hypothetical protein
MDDIKTGLKSEGYSTDQITGPALIKQLKVLMSSSLTRAS